MFSALTSSATWSKNAAARLKLSALERKVRELLGAVGNGSQSEARMDLFEALERM